MSTALITSTRPTEIAANYDNLSKGVEFLQRLQLFTKGKAIDKGLIRPGHYGVPVSDEEITDLGDSVDVIPVARRPKAIDISDTEAIITVYDENSAEFQRISAASFESESGCMFGTSVLVFERTTAKFYEFFFGTKSSRPEARNIAPFMGNACTLKARYVEKKFSWHVPVVAKCSTPFAKLPTQEQVDAEVEKFLNPKAETVEVVEQPKNRRAR